MDIKTPDIAKTNGHDPNIIRLRPTTLRIDCGSGVLNVRDPHRVVMAVVDSDKDDPNPCRSQLVAGGCDPSEVEAMTESETIMAVEAIGTWWEEQQGKGFGRTRG